MLYRRLESSSATKVIVVGGGSAGVAAAQSSRSSGADVLLIERSRSLAAPPEDFRTLLEKNPTPDDLANQLERELTEMEVEVRLGEAVNVVRGAERLVQTSERSLRYDALVVATGCSSSAPPLRGITKRRAFIMDGRLALLRLRESLDEVSRAAVLGSGLPALSLSEALIGRGKAVALFAGIGGWPPEGCSPAVSKRLASAVEAGGVRVFRSVVDAVAGVEAVEAVLSDGSVHQCDTVITFPRRTPSPAQAGYELGAGGGVVVDRWMRTSVRGVYAAGGCAELRVGSSSLPYPLRSSSALMGETAGRNAAGGNSPARMSGTFSARVFGLEVCLSGITVREARLAGLDAVEVERTIRRRDGELDVSIAFDRGTNEVYGIQAAGAGALTLAGAASVAVAMHNTLQDLAAMESPDLPGQDRGRSPIALTAGAGLGLAPRRDAEAPGAGL